MKVNVTVQVMKDDGTEFSTASHSWSGMERGEVVYFEGMMIEMLNNLNAIGKELSDGGKAKQK